MWCVTFYDFIAAEEQRCVEFNKENSPELPKVEGNATLYASLS